MPLLMSFRRYWAVVVLLGLALPTVGFFAPDLPAPQREASAPAARWWMNAGRRLDPYINTAFGFRGAVLAAHARYGRWTGATLNAVIEGEDGALFLKDDQALDQSLGTIVRPAAIAAVADAAEELNHWMAARGGRFAMVAPPNAHTVNLHLLPAAARRAKRATTETDLLADDLRERGVPFVDLRPLLIAASADAPTYRKIDTHWNMRGAVIGYNATMDRLGRPDLRVDPGEILGEPEQQWTGDLVRTAGLTRAAMPDLQYPILAPSLPRPGLQPLQGILPPAAPGDPLPAYASDTGHTGPRIMIIGDSFTRDLWLPMLALRASAVAWTHHKSCRFDRGIVERFRPDLLVLAPTERLMPCGLGKP